MHVQVPDADGFTENFSARLRGELLNETLLTSPAEARAYRAFAGRLQHAASLPSPMENSVQFRFHLQTGAQSGAAPCHGADQLPVAILSGVNPPAGRTKDWIDLGQDQWSYEGERCVMRFWLAFGPRAG